MNKDEVQEIVKETVKELRRQGLVHDDIKQIMRTVGQRLKDYYAGKPDEKLTEALDRLRNDVYFEIIPMYYHSRYTLENISERLFTDISTIGRNKKRLLIELYFEML